VISPDCLLHYSNALCIILELFPHISPSKNMRIRFSLFQGLLLVCLGVTLGNASAALSATLLGSVLFPDVQSGMYYDSAVGELYNKGIMKGYDDGTFHPNDYVTRGQIAVMFQRFMNGGEVVATNDSQSSSATTRTTTTRSSSSSVKTSSNLTANLTGKAIFSFSKEKFAFPEKVNQISLLVERSGDLSAATVEIHTESETAKENEDFLAVHKTLEFAKGETSLVVVIYIKDDAKNEGSELFHLVLSNPGNSAAVGEIGSAAITILDDEDPLGTNVPLEGKSSQGTYAFSALEYAFAEDAATATVTVNRTDSATVAASIEYDAGSNTAIEGKDFKTTKGILEFAEGEKKKNFTISLVDNDVVDGNVSAYLYLRHEGKVIAKSILTIIDTEAAAYDNGKFKFSDSNFSVQEGEKMEVVIIRLGGAKGDVSVDYATSAGTANPSMDYSDISGTMEFKEGEMKKSFFVSTKADSDNESDETVTLTLQNPTGGAVAIFPDIATLNIND